MEISDPNIHELSIKDNLVATKIYDLQKKSYFEEANLIDYYLIPPLIESFTNLQHSKEIFYGYTLRGQLVGIISYKWESINIIDINRLAVHPDFFRKGIASSLMNFLLSNNRLVEKIIVQTASRNYPAIQFYLKFRFKIVENMKVNNTLNIVKLEKYLLD